MPSFIAELLTRLAPQIGATFVVEPEFQNTGYITFASGRRVFFRDNRFDLNPLGSVKLVQDKAHTAHFLRHFGYHTPDWLTFWGATSFPGAPNPRHPSAAVAFAAAHGYPVWVKPNDASQGRAVYCCHNEAELLDAATAALAASPVALVQAHAPGHDWRIVILDGQPISAYQRIPLTVTPTGHHTLRQLIAQRQAEFQQSGRDTTIRLTDPRLLRCLARAGLTLDSTPPPGNPIRLQDIANLSAGGHCRDVTAHLHPTFAKLCAQIAQDFRLRICGIDLTAPDITAPLETYQILELNSAPGLDNYAHPDPAAQEHLIDTLYLKLLRAVEGST
jgi:D-alanine-D-alanine ligase-like ATP-grasp enzyme